MACFGRGCWVLASGWLVLGCGPKVPFEEDTDGAGDLAQSSSFGSDETSGGGVDSTTVATSVGPGTTTTTSGPSTTTSTTGPTTATTTTATATTDATTFGTDTEGSPPPGPLPDGSQCTDDFECQSGQCYSLGPLGGVCGECTSDADCDSGGCSPPNPVANPPEGSRCNAGLLGAGCESSSACDSELVCADVLIIPGFIDIRSCSECEVDSDCPGAELCAPIYQIADLSGFKVCVSPGSLPLGAGCDFEGSGDASCQSGHCAIADGMGLFELGVCSQCESEADCPGPQMCAPPQIDFQTGALLPGGCG